LNKLENIPKDKINKSNSKWLKLQIKFKIDKSNSSLLNPSSLKKGNRRWKKWRRWGRIRVLNI